MNSGFPAIAAAVFFALPSILAQAIYNPMAEFSTNTNPNGVWSYGWTTPNEQNFALLHNDYGVWAEAREERLSGREIGYGPLISLQGENIFMSTRVGPYQPILRFTAPESGTYEIRIKASSTSTSPVVIKINNQTVAADVSLAFTNSINLAAASTIDFAYADTEFAWYQGGFATLRGQIELLQTNANISAISFTPESQQFTNSLQVQLLNGFPNTTIRYTTNNTLPFSGSAQITGTLLLTNSTTILASVFSNDTQVSQVYTASYLRVPETIYNPLLEFSTTTNPNGPWSYGFLSTNNQGFTMSSTNANGIWHGFRDIPPGLGRGGAIGKTSDSIDMFSLFAEYRPALRFTIPQSGRYTARFLIQPYGGAVVHINLNNQLFLSESRVMPVAFTNQFDAVAGTSFDFICDGLQPIHFKFGAFVQGEFVFEGDETVFPYPAISLVPNHAYFTNSQNIFLLNNLSNSIVRFTMDGTDPAPGSPGFIGSITITNHAIIKAAAFSNNTQVSQIFSNSYYRVFAFDPRISAGWLETYFGNGYFTDPRVNVDADPDNDGSSNLEEFLAQTDPLDIRSGFRGTIKLLPSITFATEPGVTYHIRRKNSFDQNYTTIITITASASTTTYTDPAPGENAFYIIAIAP